MISMELSGVQRNKEHSQQFAAATEQFLARGGKIQLLKGYVRTEAVEPKPYGRLAAPAAKDADSPKAKRKAWNEGVRVSQMVKDRVQELAPTMTLAEAMKETGLSKYVLKRVADAGRFEFKQWDATANLQEKRIEPVADAFNVVRIKDARSRGLTQKAAIRELGISNTLMKRLIKEFDIDYPVRQARN
jgi:hypothetical protein